MASSMSWTFSWKGLSNRPASNSGCNTCPCQVIARPAGCLWQQPKTFLYQLWWLAHGRDLQAGDADERPQASN